MAGKSKHKVALERQLEVVTEEIASLESKLDTARKERAILVKVQTTAQMLTTGAGEDPE